VPESEITAPKTNKARRVELSKKNLIKLKHSLIDSNQLLNADLNLIDEIQT